jgi:hypothetical protein
MASLHQRLQVAIDAADHAVKFGAKIVWIPMLSAANHLSQLAGQVPKTTKKMLDAMSLSSPDPNGKVTDEAKQVLDLTAEADVILAGGHLHVSEHFAQFKEAHRRGLRKLLVNRPTCVVACSDEDMRSLVRLGAYHQHEAGMFIEGRRKKHEVNDAAHLIEVGGVDHTTVSSDLVLIGSQRPTEGFRSIVRMLLDLQVPESGIRHPVGINGAVLPNLADVETPAKHDVAMSKT